LAYNFPERPTQTQRDAAAQLLLSLKALLPCAKCRRHYSDYLDQHAIEEATASRESLARYLYTLHNEVNQRLGRTNRLTFEQAERMYATPPTAQPNWSWLIIGLLVGALLAVAAQSAMNNRNLRRSINRFVRA
jgi:hypothetical protein